LKSLQAINAANTRSWLLPALIVAPVAATMLLKGPLPALAVAGGEVLLYGFFKLRRPWLLLALALPLWLVGELEVNVGPLSLNPPIIAGSLASFLVIGQSLRRGEPLTRYTPLTPVALLLLLTTALSTLHGATLFAPARLFKLFAACALFALLTGTRHSEKSLEAFLKLLLYASTLVVGGLVCWYLFHFHYGALGIYVKQATTVGKNRAGYFLTLVMPLALAYFLHHPRRLEAAAMLAVLGFATVYSLSRGTWVALACAILVLGVASVKRRNFVVVAALTGLLVFAALSLPGPAQRLPGRFASLFALERTAPASSIQQRKALAGASLAAFAAHPFKGIGLARLAEIEPTGLGYRSAHDDYLQIAAEQGVFGSLAFLALMVQACRMALFLLRRSGSLQQRWMAEGLAAAMVAMAVRHFFIYAYDSLAFWTLLALLSLAYELVQAGFLPCKNPRACELARNLHTQITLTTEGDARCAYFMSQVKAR